MKILAKNIESFIKSPDENIIAILLYGPDIGLVSQRKKFLMSWALADINDPFNLAEINSDSLKTTPSLIIDEMAAISFTNQRRLILFSNASNSDSKAIESAINAGNTTQEQAFLVVTAGDLKPGSLRKLFENSNLCAALPCYQDDVRNLSSLIIQEFRANNITYDTDIIPYIAVNCQGDRLIIKSELQKLFIYLGEKTHASFSDVKNIINETTESHFDDICNSMAMGNHNLVIHHLSKSLLQGVLPIVILRSIQRFFNRLQLVQAYISAGNTQDQALKNLYPPVFFKQAPLFKQILSKWNCANSNKLWHILNELYQAELECKNAAMNANLICNRTLLKITSICR